MTRAVDLGESITDHFPVWDLDGVTKKSGESSFAVTLWLDGNVTTEPHSIIEINTSGEYRLKFTPTAEGVYSAEVIPDYSGDAFVAEYQVRKPALKFGLSAADDNTTATFAVWADLRGERVTTIDSVAAVVRSADGTEVVDLGTDAADTADGVFEFSTASTNIDAGAEYYLDVTATKGAVSWYANLGFSKV